MQALAAEGAQSITAGDGGLGETDQRPGQNRPDQPGASARLHLPVHTMALLPLIRLSDWLRLTLASCGLALLLMGCAQPPAASPSSRSDLPTQQGREVFAAAFADALKHDQFYETSVGVSRTMPAYPAFKTAMTKLYTDDVVIDWLYASLQRGEDREATFKQLGSRMFEGLARLDDESSLQLLSALGDIMGRLSPEQCQEFSAPKDRAKSEFGRMLAWMTPDEVTRFFGGMHQGLRASLQNKPLRPTPTREQFSTMLAALGQQVPGGLYKKSSGNSCRDGQELMQAVNRLSGVERSHAITFVMNQVGFYARGSLQKKLA